MKTLPSSTSSPSILVNEMTTKYDFAAGHRLLPIASPNSWDDARQSRSQLEFVLNGIKRGETVYGGNTSRANPTPLEDSSYNNYTDCTTTLGLSSDKYRRSYLCRIENTDRNIRDKHCAKKLRSKYEGEDLGWQGSTEGRARRCGWKIGGRMGLGGDKHTVRGRLGVTTRAAG